MYGYLNLGDDGEISTVNWFLSSALLLLADARRYVKNDCLSVEGLLEVEAECLPSPLVHEWKCCCVSALRPHAGCVDQDC